MKICNYCKNSFDPRRIDQIYCSKACKMVSFWLKRVPKKRKVKK